MEAGCVVKVANRIAIKRYEEIGHKAMNCCCVRSK